jgi:hypothetical protein
MDTSFTTSRVLTNPPIARDFDKQMLLRVTKDISTSY